jgi:hypothetical protein
MLDPRHESSVGFSFAYQLLDAGWAKATVSHESQTADLTASYLSDALRDLLNAVGHVVSGHRHSTVVWEEEPGEYRWYFDRTDSGIRVRIFSFNVYGDEADDDDQNDDKEILIFEVVLPRGELARSISTAASAVLELHGEELYLKKWMRHPFPAAALNALNREIDILEA